MTPSHLAFHSTFAQSCASGKSLIKYPKGTPLPPAQGSGKKLKPV
jgi:hypothetical protein